MKLYTGWLLVLLVSQTVSQQQGNDNKVNNQNNQQSGQGTQNQQGYNNPPKWPYMGNDQQYQYNPTGGVQAMVTPLLHAGAQASYTLFDVGMNIIKMPFDALKNMQTGITGFFNAFANPIWVAPTKSPYDLSLSEILAQLPQSSTTQKPITNKPTNQNQNSNQNQNRPSNQG